ncbi:MAG TPA: ABC transporter permease, partial [Bryobacteraceae bacterium]|nr:ABC transporter permease [Bryobacteraceae bacterium]
MRRWFERGSRVAREIESEMDSHMDRYAADLVARGAPPEEARRLARLEFGSTAAVAEECREAVGLRWPDEIARDLRYAARVLRKSPTFTATAVATLALCIGANTAIFSVVDAVLLRPLPYPHPERLATVARYYWGKGESDYNIPQTGQTWEALRDGATGMDAAAFSYGPTKVNFVAGHSVQNIRQGRVSTGFFRVLGISPLMGREFSPVEDRAGGPPVTVLSYTLWKNALYGDPAVIGRAVMLRGEPHTIVGVMPFGFQSSTQADLWTPLRPSRTGEGGGSNYNIVVRLRPGVTWAQADGQVASVGASALEKSGSDNVRLRLISFQRGLTEGLRTPLLILWAAVGLVLLIGCVNIAGLLLARAAGRTRELATRMALGSGRGALIRQLLAESMLLGLCGGAAGAALGWLGVKALTLLAQDSLNVWQSVELDWRVLAAAAAVSLLASILFGLYPAVVASRLEIRAALGEAGRGVAGGRNPWPRRFLVAGEVALGVVLLVGAGLLIRTFAHLRGLTPGFDSRHVITARLSLQDARYGTRDRVNHLFDQSLARIRELPGVESAAVTLTLPYEQALNVGFKRLDGRHVDTTDWQITNFFYVTPEYFKVLRIPLLRGRVFTAADTNTTAPVAVVSEAFVRMYLGGDDALNRHLDLGGGEKREIVGVVGDIQQKSGWGEQYGPVASVPDIYVPATQTEDKMLQMVHVWFSPSWIVRASGAPEGVIAGMQRALESVDPQLPFAGFHSMEDVRYHALAQERFQAVLLGALAGLALLLAAVGIYGLIANSVAERTRELGIRLALGATVAQAMRAVALPGVVLALAGVVTGSVLAGFASQLLRHLVWGVRPG